MRDISRRLAALPFAAAGVISAGAAAAADATTAAPTHVDEVVVTGTYAANVTQASSASPISVYGGRRLTSAGFPDLGRVLDQISPVINLPHTATAPSGDNTRPITMKGLSPDEVLVLVDGKRWQTSSVLVFNNAVGRGTAPYDLGAIPLAAVERVEVLSDSAAAQYGSDAIAGVVNIILKSNAAGGLASAQGGVTGEGDGWNWDLSASHGFKLGEAGRITLTGDIRHQDRTNRATIDPPFGKVEQQVGDPRALDVGFTANAAYPVGRNLELYGSAITEWRDSVSPGLFRAPSVSPLWPSGFVPEAHPKIWNVTVIAGLRGEVGGGFRIDLSNAFGFDNAHFDVANTANAALKAASPTVFYAGSEQYWQDTANLTVTHPLPARIMPGTAALGIEGRAEHYAIEDGQPYSYLLGGAQGFPGFAPRIPVDNGRNAAGVFVDVAANPVKPLSLEAAGRYDHYNDFGGALTWKASGRLEVTDWLAFRGSAGTGFRAPSLQQEYFSSVVSQINTTGAFVRTGTYQVRDPIAEALGARPLKPESSTTFSGGVVLRPAPGFVLTADGYNIDITDRIALSDQLKGPAVSAILLAHGVSDVQQAQFFTNAAHTRTRGYELTADFSHDFGEVTVSTGVQWGQYRTTLLNLAPNPVLPSLPLLGLTSKGLLISAQPLDKVISHLTVEDGRFSATLGVEHYGPWVSAPLGVVQTFSSKTVADLSARARLTSRVTLSAGALNLGDVHPDLVIGAAALGLTYGGESPFGDNGRTFYVRLDARL
jgi:iron complex outermembrane receptor protein